MRADATHIKGTPTELIIVTGRTDTGRGVEIAIGKEMAERILTVAAAAYAVCGHVGHAMWHAEKNNTDFKNCSSCQNRSK